MYRTIGEKNIIFNLKNKEGNYPNSDRDPNFNIKDKYGKLYSNIDFTLRDKISLKKDVVARVDGHRLRVFNFNIKTRTIYFKLNKIGLHGTYIHSVRRHVVTRKHCFN